MCSSDLHGSGREGADGAPEFGKTEVLPDSGKTEVLSGLGRTEVPPDSGKTEAPRDRDDTGMTRVGSGAPASAGPPIGTAEDPGRAWL